jgi:hypothetical protein
MKKYALLLLLLLVLTITGCSSANKKIVCKMNAVVTMEQPIVAILDSNNKVAEIEVHTIYDTEEEAQNEFESFKVLHGDNVIIEKNVIIVKNAHDSSTMFGRQLSKGVGYTKEEFQEFLGNYICE